ncbi:MAG: YCF48-related protein [Bacteroidia bacterium]|nr:YCF48-related protein [Bacteroidia bacterium]
MNNLHGCTFFCCILVGMAVNVSAQTWTPQTLPTTKTLRSVYFLNSNEGWAAGYDGILHTTDGGSTWSSQLSNSLERLLAIRFVDVNCGWANSGHWVLRTDNRGASWRGMTGLDPNAGIFRNVIFPVSSTVAWATAQGGGMRWFYRYTATSSKAVIEQTFGLIGSIAQLIDLWFVDQDNGWAVGTYGQIWKITNASSESPGFTNQTNPSVAATTLWGVFFYDVDHGWAVGDAGTIITTTDGGTNWSALESGTNTNLKDVHFTNINNGCVVGEGGLIRVSTDGGVNWSTLTSGVTTTLWSVIYVGSAPGYVAGGDFAISGNGTILRTDNTLPVQLMNEPPTEFTLDQNFPNPFNLSTEIGFYVPHDGLLSLKVYDLLGNQVETLINEKLQPGRYSKTFNASGLPGGVYFYRIQASEFNQTRKLLLLK